MSDTPPPTPRDPGDDAPTGVAAEPYPFEEPYEVPEEPYVPREPSGAADEPPPAEERYAPEPYPQHRPHRPAKPPELTGEPAFPHHTASGGHDPGEEYFTPNPPNVPYFPATPPRRTLDRTTALVAALVLTALLAMAGWTTAALGLTRDRTPARTPVVRSATPVAPTASAAPGMPSLAEAPCGPAAAAAESQGLTELRSTPSATLDGTGTGTGTGASPELRLKLRCTLSSEQFDLSVDLLRSPDADAVDEFFDFHRRSAVGGASATGLPDLGERAFVTVDDAAVGGRTTIGVDVAGNRRALSIVGTTSGEFTADDARTLLVAIARAYLTAR